MALGGALARAQPRPPTPHPLSPYLPLPPTPLHLCTSIILWHGVVRYHGPKPVPAANRIWVANHTSMIDYCLLCAYTPFAVIMQLHTGWVRFIQVRTWLIIFNTYCLMQTCCSHLRTCYSLMYTCYCLMYT